MKDHKCYRILMTGKIIAKNSEDEFRRGKDYIWSAPEAE